MVNSIKPSCFRKHTLLLQRIVTVLSGMVFSLTLCAQQVAVPAGWIKQQLADTVQLKPSGSGNRLYTYTVFPLTSITGDGMSNWAKKMIMNDLPAVGTTTDPVLLNKVIEHIYSSNYSAKDKWGKPIVLSYLIYETSDGKGRIARVIADPDKTFYMPYLNTSVRHFMAMAKESGLSGSTESRKASTERSGTAASSGNVSGRNKIPVDQIRAAPDKGLAASEIDGIYINLETGVGIGGYPIQEYNPYLLLQDHSIYKRLLLEPQQLDAKRSKELEPDQWGTWKRSGDNIIVNWNNGKNNTWSVWHKTLPAGKGTRLSGYYRSIGGGGSLATGGDVITFSSDGITFFADGKYVRGKSSGAAAGGSGSYGTGSRSSKSSGTYSISGNKIVMKDDAGAVSELAFYFFPDKNKQPSDVIGIGNDVYSK